MSGTSDAYPSAIPFPYTVVISYTPLTAAAGTSTASFDCASATGTNFSIANAPPFSAPSTSAANPTLGEWAVVALAGILGLASMLAVRRRRSA